MRSLFFRCAFVEGQECAPKESISLSCPSLRARDPLARSVTQIEATVLWFFFSPPFLQAKIRRAAGLGAGRRWREEVVDERGVGGEGWKWNLRKKCLGKILQGLAPGQRFVSHGVSAQASSAHPAPAGCRGPGFEPTWDREMPPAPRPALHTSVARRPPGASYLNLLVQGRQQAVGSSFKL